MTPFLQSAEHRADMAALHRRLAGQRKREMERFWAELPDRDDHMAMIVADEESRLAAEAAREAPRQSPRPDKPSEAAMEMLFEGYSPEAINREYPGVSMLGTRGTV